MYERYGKRAMDIGLTTIVITLFAVPMLFIAILVKLDSKGPVIFTQKRYGKDRKHFTLYKFRSMSTLAPGNIATNRLSDSHNYITRSGKIMRKLSVDELPQLLNVLKGDMSIIGPRPVILAETNLIKLREEVNANRVKPGITGWAQINGRDELDDFMKSQLDGQYIQRFSFITDIKCLIKTIVVIFSLSGHSEGHEQADSLQVSIRHENTSI